MKSPTYLNEHISSIATLWNACSMRYITISDWTNPRLGRSGARRRPPITVRSNYFITIIRFPLKIEMDFSCDFLMWYQMVGWSCKNSFDKIKISINILHIKEFQPSFIRSKHMQPLSYSQDRLTVLKQSKLFTRFLDLMSLAWVFSASASVTTDNTRPFTAWYFWASLELNSVTWRPIT